MYYGYGNKENSIDRKNIIRTMSIKLFIRKKIEFTNRTRQMKLITFHFYLFISKIKFRISFKSNSMKIF